MGMMMKMMSKGRAPITAPMIRLYDINRLVAHFMTKWALPKGIVPFQHKVGCNGGTDQGHGK
jgi:hypothetical protein